MPLPFSRSKIERLGEGLIAGPDPVDEDIADLHRLLEAYDDVLTATLTRVRESVDVAPTSRVKNTGTILEKLHRHGGSWLKSMHDLAGMRIVSAVDRNEQDELVRQLVELFEDEPREPRVIDRREQPSHGYRAVHVIAFPEDMAVEIQVRTRWQHEWADMFEKLADRVGRDIRYGEPPAHPRADDRPREVRDAEHRARVAVVELALVLAELGSVVERIEALAPGSPEASERRLTISRRLADLRRDIESYWD